jgi:hypothetical protein
MGSDRQSRRIFTPTLFFQPSEVIIEENKIEDTEQKRSKRKTHESPVVSKANIGPKKPLTKILSDGLNEKSRISEFSEFSPHNSTDPKSNMNVSAQGKERRNSMRRKRWGVPRVNPFSLEHANKTKEKVHKIDLSIKIPKDKKQSEQSE